MWGVKVLFGKVVCVWVYGFVMLKIDVYEGDGYWYGVVGVRLDFDFFFDLW